MVTKTGILKTFLKDKGFGFVKMDEDIDDVFVHVRDNLNLSTDIVGQHRAIELTVTKTGNRHGRKRKARNLTLIGPPTVNTDRLGTTLLPNQMFHWPPNQTTTSALSCRDPSGWATEPQVLVSCRTEERIILV